VSLADALERAAGALPGAADALRDANGDPDRVLDALGSEGAGPVLVWLLANETDDAGELLEAWAERDEGPALLAALAEDELPKPARKLLRKARHRLRSRGVAVEEPTPEPRVARLAGAEGEGLDAAFVSPIDPTGMRVVTWIESHPGGGARLLQIVVDARRGVVECEAYSATKGRARRFARDLASRDKLPATPVEQGAARALLARAVERQAADRPLPRAFAELRSHLTEPADAATPGELAEAALEAQAGPAGVRRVVELLREREILPWLLPQEGLRAAAEKLQELEKGKIILSGPRKREQADEILNETAASLVDADEAARVAEWLRETAYLLWKAEREADAGACLGAARDMLDGSPQESELPLALLELALAPLLERLREEEREEDESSLLVKP
jgi:hypothetical protein